MEEGPPAEGMNLLDLRGPTQRWKGFYWTSVIVSIVVHGGFLAYVLAFARPPGPSAPRSRPPSVDVEVIGTAPFAALQRGDRQDVPSDAPPEPRLEETPPQPRLNKDAEGAKADASPPGASALANRIAVPLPEDGARARPVPLPERYRLAAGPAADPAPAIATPRALRGMSLPARRVSRIAADVKLSGRRVADPHADDGAGTTPAAMPLPPLKLLARPEKAAPAPGSEESRAPAQDVSAQGSPVAAELPREAGVAMFGARIIVDDAPMLPEDRQAVPDRPQPKPSMESRPVPPPERRAANLAARSAQVERGDANGAGDDGADDRATARKARAYQGNVRAHLAANRPAGAYGSGRAVVAFNLSPAGALRSVRIVRSSESPVLDQSVVQSVYSAAPFPKPPKGIKPAQLRFVIPFEFR